MIILQDRQKWLDKKRNFMVGDIVLVKDDDLPRNQWSMGRITEVYHSNDGLVRSTNVCSSLNEQILPRSITKLVLLIGSDEQ